MADNTKQFRWIAKIKGNLEWQYIHDPNTFVAGDHIWYPLEGFPKIRIAPDTFVVKGRPKKDRGSYQQWKEDDIPPQVAFEILSPGNTKREMERKLKFYNRYGVDEYYVYDPDNNEVEGYIRNEHGQLEEIPTEKFIVDDGWTSPALGIKMRLTVDTLLMFHPDGKPYMTLEKLGILMETYKRQAEEAEERAQAAERQAAAERERNQQLIAKLRELGIDPNSL